MRRSATARGKPAMRLESSSRSVAARTRQRARRRMRGRDRLSRSQGRWSPSPRARARSELPASEIPLGSVAVRSLPVRRRTSRASRGSAASESTRVTGTPEEEEEPSELVGGADCLPSPTALSTGAGAGAGATGLGSWRTTSGFDRFSPSGKLDQSGDGLGASGCAGPPAVEDEGSTRSAHTSASVLRVTVCAPP